MSNMSEKRKTIAQLSVEAVRLQLEGKSATHILDEIRERQKVGGAGRCTFAATLKTGKKGDVESALQVTTKWPRGSKVAVDRSIDDVIVLRLVKPTMPVDDVDAV
jgi:hypothetical protein